MLTKIFKLFNKLGKHILWIFEGVHEERILKSNLFGCWEPNTAVDFLSIFIIQTNKFHLNGTVYYLWGHQECTLIRVWISSWEPRWSGYCWDIFFNPNFLQFQSSAWLLHRANLVPKQMLRVWYTVLTLKKLKYWF